MSHRLNTTQTGTDKRALKSLQQKKSGKFNEKMHPRTVRPEFFSPSFGGRRSIACHLNFKSSSKRESRGIKYTILYDNVTKIKDHRDSGDKGEIFARALSEPWEEWGEEPKTISFEIFPSMILSITRRRASAMRRWDNKVYQAWRTVTTEQGNKQSFELRPSKRVYIAQFRPSVSLCRGSRRNSSDPSPIWQGLKFRDLILSHKPWLNIGRWSTRRSIDFKLDLDYVDRKRRRKRRALSYYRFGEIDRKKAAVRKL